MRSGALRCLLPSLKTPMRTAMLVIIDGFCANPLERPPSRPSDLQTMDILRQHPFVGPSEREARPESVINAQRLCAAAPRRSLAVARRLAAVAGP